MTMLAQNPCPVYCINLNRSRDRRMHMEQEFVGMNWDVQYIEAVDGSMLDPATLLREGTIHKEGQGLVGALTPGEIGCALSHERAWQAFAATTATVALICEDDVHFSRELDLHRIIRRIPASADLIYLYYSGQGTANQPFETSSSLAIDIGSHRLHRVTACGSTLAYIATRRALSTLMRNTRPIRYPVDGTLGRLAFNGDLNVFAIEPMAVNYVDFSSTIR